MAENFISVAVPRPLDQAYSYLVPDELSAVVKERSWVKVPFGKGVTHAFVLEGPKPLSELQGGLDRAKLKSVLSVGGADDVLPEEIYSLCRFVHEYYHVPLGEVINCAAPSAALGLKTKSSRTSRESDSTESKVFELNQDQRSVTEELWRLKGAAAGKGAVGLLQGVTGSGKTEVYIEIARRTLKLGQGVLILVPEIALTPQLFARFRSALGCEIGIWHSAVAAGVRRTQWLQMIRGELRAVVGARSAVFAPVRDLGLIVVDEEHDPSYKQEDRVRYNARDLALVRGSQSNSLVVLGSATPSLESLERVRDGKYRLHTLPNRVAHGSLPQIEIVNLGVEPPLADVRSVLTDKAVQAIHQTVSAGNQVMVFLNRRGFASFLVCEDCGEVSECPRCSISLTVHKRANRLRCHLCDHFEAIAESCAKCGSFRLKPVGGGTEGLEEDLVALVPGLKPVRLDRDQVTSATRLEKLLNDFRRGKANVLLGTQMVVKGHDFPGVTLVVVILADALFRWHDFRAPERAYQILTQVSGRAGRGSQSGKVLIQTYCPTHPVLQAVLDRTLVPGFLENERVLRQELMYPPFARLVRLRVEHSSSQMAQQRAKFLAQKIRADNTVEILGPSEAYVEKVKDIYRWDILIKAKRIQELHKKLWEAKSVATQDGWSILIDVDPIAFN